MTEFSSNNPEEVGRPWLSDEEILMHMPCSPGHEAEVISFMRNLEPEYYVEAQEFFATPTKFVVDRVISAYDRAAEKEESVSEVSGSITIIDYLLTLDKIPYLEQPDDLCEGHDSSYWAMGNGPRLDQVTYMELSYVKICLERYQEHQNGQRQDIALPDDIFDNLDEMEQERYPEIKQARFKSYEQVVEGLLEGFEIGTAVLNRMLQEELGQTELN